MKKIHAKQRKNKQQVMKNMPFKAMFKYLNRWSMYYIIKKGEKGIRNFYRTTNKTSKTEV